MASLRKRSKIDKLSLFFSRCFVWLVRSLIRFYQFFISPMLGTNCRFYPSCSQYSLDAINQYGIIKGGYLSLRRILKCHPWHAGGIDPVPLPSKQCSHALCQTSKTNTQHSGSNSQC